MILTRLFGVFLHLKLLIAALIDAFVHATCRDEQLFTSLLLFFLLFLLFGFEI
jgi:hypothetical protein